MKLHAVLEALNSRGIWLGRKGSDLVVRGNKDALDAPFIAKLKEHKLELLGLLADELSSNSFTRITPDLLPLIVLDQTQIDGIVASVAGGARNVKDIYPLAPLQEGILFHHLLNRQGDAYLLSNLLSFDSRERVDRFLAALQAVIDRHDILRTAVLWEGLPEPVQVVWREAKLKIEEVRIEEGDVAQGLKARFDPRHYRIDVRQAPLMRGFLAPDAAEDRWVLLLLNHHLANDHTTMEILIAEVQAHLLGEESQLPTPLPFRNFVAQTRLGVSREEHEAFFTKMLGDIDEPTAPFGLIDTQQDGSAILEGRAVLERELARRIRRAARAAGVSAASVFHLAWAMVLAKATGREDVVFGTVLFGRMQAGEGADRVLGMFINTLPVRVSIDQQGVRDSLLSTHRILSQLLRHEHASLTLAQRCSAVMAPAPLFSSLLNYRYSQTNAEVGGESTAAVSGWEGMSVLAAEERTNYPLGLSVDDLGEGFGLTAQVEGSQDPQRICAFMMRALSQLTDALERRPATSIQALDVLPEAERHQLLHLFNDTAQPYPKDRCIQELFEEQVSRTPEAVAVAYEDEQLTYAALNARANQLAHYLRERGVGPDQRVAICVERSLEMVVGILGILKAGGAYVPLDPHYPIERLRYMLEDSDPAAVLGHAKTRDTLAELLAGRESLLIDLDGQSWQDYGTENLPPQSLGLTSRHLAYIIYTSGSTGQPKGVMVEHRNTANLLHWAKDWDRQNALESVLFSTSLNFDLAVYECFAPLVAGRKVIVVKDALDLARRSRAVTLINTVPSAIKALMEVGQVPPETRVVNLAGEALKREVVERIFGQSATQEVCNLYGPSETTTYSTGVRMSREQGFDTSIGRPIWNTQIYILDTHRQPVPVGVVGEIYIGGAGVARGYLNREELTAERFLKDPFSANPDARMYRTGDLGRWRADGNIEYLGRNDSQVKIRGFRIELGEIEARLQECAEIREAVVIAREDQAGEKRLVAYYVADEADTQLSVSELRSHLEQGLPEYMVPAAYVQLAHMPLTPNGKLDRKALPAPEGDAYARREYEAPQGEVEEAIAQIWQELLRVDRVSRHDNFFEIGGHSLLAVQAVARIRERFSVELPLQVMFSEGSVQAIAAALEQAQPTRWPAIELANRSEPLPLSFAQQRLWFMSQMEGMNRAYNIPSGFELRGTLDRKALRAALDRVVARHEALRTTIRSVGGNAAQIIANSQAKFVLTEHDLSGAPHPQEEIQRLSAEEAGAIFDLQNGPLIRGRLLRLSDEEHVLLITTHHMISDGRSMRVLLSELSALYDAFSNGSPDPLPPLTIQYADYAVWQRKWLTSDIRDRQLDYWRGQLTGAVPVDLPTDYSRPLERTHRGGLCTFQIGEKTSKKLHALMRADGVTLHMLTLAAFQVFLSRLTAQQDITIVMAASVRVHEELEKLIGLFVNSLLIRVDVNPGRSFREHLAQVKRTAVKAYENKDVPFEQVIATMRTDLGVSGSVALIELNVDVMKQQGLRPSTLTSLSSSQVSAKGDLMLEGHGSEQGLNLSLIYSMDIFSEATVSGFGQQLTRILEQIADEPGVALRTLLSPDEAERRRVLIEWNDTATSYPHDRCIHELIEDQVAKAPGAIAVASDGPALTYGQLNSKSNQLARYLRARGVAPECRVALCMVRGQEMVIAMLAVLKAGGSYVPLNPEYPKDRLTYILEDAGTTLVLTQQRLRQVFPVQGIAVVALEEAWDTVEKESRENLSRAETGLTPNHLAYVIYTSGSTGRPKGVMVEHRNVVNHNWHMRRSFSLTSDDCVLQFASYSFDASIEEFFPTLMAGARLLVRDAEVPTPEALCGQVRRHAVSVLNFPTAYWHAWSAGIEALLQTLDSLRLVVVGGEKVSAEAVRHWNRVAPRGCRLLNTYGPTEATVSCTTYEIQQTATGLSEIPIGRPISNTRVYILNERQEPAPVGVAGEIYVGGAGVARGYLNRPDLTAERFLKDPFDTSTDARMYRTGDLGRWRADGNVEYLGRNDSQVKIRGFRVELGEIEARLQQCAGIRQAVVVAREDRPGDRRLVAYLVSDSSGAQGNLSDMRTHLQSTLPEYMVPAAYVYLDRMPLTPNGKLDRRALPVPEDAAFHRRDDEAPQGEAEEVIAQIWQELLGVERVGRNDNFFDLGGHSLLALQARDRINERLSVEMPLTAFFRTPTLARLAAKAADYRASKFKELVDATINVSHDDLVKHVESMSEEQIDQLMKGIE